MGFAVRLIVEEDLEKIMNWRMSPDVTEYMNTDPQLTLDKQRKWFFSIKNNNSLNKGVIKLHQLCGCKILDIVKEKIEKKGVKFDVTYLSITKDEWKRNSLNYQYDLIDFVDVG